MPHAHTSPYTSFYQKPKKEKILPYKAPPSYYLCPSCQNPVEPHSTRVRCWVCPTCEIMVGESAFIRDDPTTIEEIELKITDEEISLHRQKRDKEEQERLPLPKFKKEKKGPFQEGEKSLRISSWGFRSQMSAELFGEPTWARTIPMRLVRNTSSGGSKALYTLSEEMVRYLQAPTETCAALYQEYLESLRSGEERLLGVKRPKPLSAEIYLDFLRLIWKYAPESGRASESMVSTLAEKYGKSVRSLYQILYDVERHFIATHKLWYLEKTREALSESMKRQRRLQPSPQPERPQEDA